MVVGLPTCGRQGTITQKWKHRAQKLPSRALDRVALRGLLSSWWPASDGWLQPVTVLTARPIKFSAEITF